MPRWICNFRNSFTCCFALFIFHGKTSFASNCFQHFCARLAWRVLCAPREHVETVFINEYIKFVESSSREVESVAEKKEKVNENYFKFQVPFSTPFGFLHTFFRANHLLSALNSTGYILYFILCREIHQKNWWGDGISYKSEVNKLNFDKLNVVCVEDARECQLRFSFYITKSFILSDENLI